MNVCFLHVHSYVKKLNVVFTENQIAGIVISKGIKIHKTLGPGLLESAYEECLFFELLNSGLKVEKQKALPLVYEEIKMKIGYRVDLMVENKFIIEVKSVDSLNEVHLAQIITYLKLSNCKLGLLMNFNTVLLTKGIKRVINSNPHS